jgi:hypothetical protein
MRVGQYERAEDTRQHAKVAHFLLSRHDENERASGPVSVVVSARRTSSSSLDELACR